MSPARGWNIGGQHAPRGVPCRNGCGTILVRRAYFNRAVCAACRQKARKGEDKVRLQEARRYRVLMHLMGYDPTTGFEECKADIKASEMAFRTGPETRSARVDSSIERRNSRADSRRKSAGGAR